MLALLAAGANALATVLQRLGIEEASPSLASSRALMASLLRRPIWFAGLALTTVSFLLQAVALSIGNLTTVQPVMVTEILFLVIILGTWFHQALGWREILGAMGTTAGLGVFLAVSSSTPGREHPSHSDWVLLLIACIGGFAVSILAGHRGPRWWRAAAYGVGAGVSFALTAAFIKTAADQWSQGPIHLLTHFEAYGIVVAGLSGLIISQHALEAGPVAASQSTLLVVNPIASIVMGKWLFDDQSRASGGRAIVEALALAVMFAALFVLSSSPLVATGAEERLSTSSYPKPHVSPT